MSAEDTTRELALLREEIREAIAAGRFEVEPSEPSRLRMAEVVRGLLAAVSKTGGEHSTVKIGRNAAGAATFEVSVRTGESEAVSTASEASAEALRLYRELDELLPYIGKADRG